MESDYVDEEQGNDLEVGRIARFFLFKNRDRSVIKRAQLRAIQDQSKDSKKSNSLKHASDALSKSLGLTIIDYMPEGKKQTSSKLFLVREEKYPNELPIPFTPHEKQQYGILTLIFFALHFKNGKMDLDQLWQTLKTAGVTENSEIIGHWPDQIHVWAKQEYLKEKKIEADAGPRIEISYGARFYVEYGEETIVRMAKYLINDGVEPEEPKEQQPEEQNQEGTQQATESQSQVSQQLIE